MFLDLFLVFAYDIFFFDDGTLVSISSIFLTRSYDKYFFSDQERKRKGCLLFKLTHWFAIYGIPGGVFLT